MADLFRGHDLTAVVEKVAQSQWDRLRDKLTSLGGDSQETRSWADLPAISKHSLKENLLPIVSDVLDALESEDVQPIDVKPMVEYRWSSVADIIPNHDNPYWYEAQEAMHDTSTATVWALHLHVKPDTHQAILDRMARQTETTGQYGWHHDNTPDSWTEWGSPNKGDDDLHLTIYFHSTPERAASVGTYLATCAAFEMKDPDLADPKHFAVSTSGDFAEQVHVD